MTVIEHQVVIAAPPETVFDYMADLRNEREWNPDCVLVEPLTDGPIREGTSWRAKWKGGPVLKAVIYAYDRPRSITSGNQGALEIRSTWTVSLTDEGTHLHSRFEAAAHGPMKLLLPIFIRKLRRDAPASLVRIKTALEEHSSG
jgi:uncharacterized protein YndB with AHSA1/START domain